MYYFNIDCERIETSPGEVYWLSRLGLLYTLIGPAATLFSAVPRACFLSFSLSGHLRHLYLKYKDCNQGGYLGS